MPPPEPPGRRSSRRRSMAGRAVRAAAARGRGKPRRLPRCGQSRNTCGSPMAGCLAPGKAARFGTGSEAARRYPPRRGSAPPVRPTSNKACAPPMRNRSICRRRGNHWPTLRFGPRSADCEARAGTRLTARMPPPPDAIGKRTHGVSLARSSISFSVKSLPRLTPLHLWAAADQLSGSARFEGQNGHVLHWLGRTW